MSGLVLKRITSSAHFRVVLWHDPKAVTPERVSCVVLEFEHRYISVTKKTKHNKLIYYNLRPNLRPRLDPSHFRRYVFAKMTFPERLDKVVGCRLGRRLK